MDENLASKPPKIVNDSNVIVRDGKQSDKDGINYIISQGFMEDVLFIIGKTNDVEKDEKACLSMVNSIKKDVKDVLVAEKNGKIVGICEMKYSNTKDNDDNAAKEFSLLTKLKCFLSFGMSEHLLKLEDGECHLNLLAVDKELRGNGVGKILLHSAHQEAIRRGFRKIFLFVYLENFQGKRLYESFGYLPKTLFIINKYFAFGNKGGYKMEKKL
ncbi:DgyrCDS14411 [Dimorphilus gyrociliatus]|uniref:DgyrCDS14411 n=1 Tax=Dimorphilus gyrociliatus TaxID=2664684 RepID=A0A7I8WDJ4_9ANNE|nr:DgyrCDS14411 [Dimorphilus gyrociliatus]